MDIAVLPVHRSRRGPEVGSGRIQDRFAEGGPPRLVTNQGREYVPAPLQAGPDRSADGLLAGALDRALFRLVAVTAEALTVEHLLDEGLECVMVALVDGLVGVFDEDALVLRSALARLPESRLLRDAYRHREAEARESNRRFVELGQAAGRIGAGDTDEMADALVVLGQGLNNPVLLGHDDRPALAARLSAAMVALLSPTS